MLNSQMRKILTGCMIKKGDLQKLKRFSAPGNLK
jgi:hypothetical protein